MRQISNAVSGLLVICMLLAGSSPAEAQHTRRRNNAVAQPAGNGPKPVEIRGYLVYSDLAEPQLATVLHRLERMSEEYQKRTAALSGRSDDRKLPFYLFSREDDYIKAGGKPGSAGAYNGERLLALVGQNADGRAWHVIQHEAFHQHLHARLGEDLPIWLNEGLAEYFGEGLYTGDNFVTGLASPFRVRRVQSLIRQQKPSLNELINMTHEQWNRRLDVQNYDVAWSLVHFLAHADGGAYQNELVQFIRASSNGQPALGMFERTVGAVDKVQAQWERFWLEQTDEMIRQNYAEVAVQTICSYGMRAAMANERISAMPRMVELATRDALPQPARDELPPQVLQECLAWAAGMGNWDLDFGPKSVEHVRLKLMNGPTFSARATVRGGVVQSVESWSDQKKPNARKRR